MDSNKVIIYTDGACSGNPGPGGWGALLSINKLDFETSGFSANTTNNRMELTAVIESLNFLDNSSNIILYTDSKYVKDGITKWIQNWKKNGWINSSKKPVKNSDLWKKLDELTSLHTIEWAWVKGHSGDPGNERVDCLARNQIKKNT